MKASQKKLFSKVCKLRKILQNRANRESTEKGKKVQEGALLVLKKVKSVDDHKAIEQNTEMLVNVFENKHFYIHRVLQYSKLLRVKMEIRDLSEINKNDSYSQNPLFLRYF